MPSIQGNLNHPDNQRGWVLVVGLVILVMLTILAMALMKTARLEEKMAGATRDMNLSFQAAETALRGAETFIESQTDESIFNTSANEIYSQADDEPDDLFKIVWENTNSKTMFADGVEALQGVASSPRYMIKKLKKLRLTITGYGDAPPPTVFRITVRGTGGTNNRATLLRSHYSKVF
jgi:type IV pilus assembly protein PilX